MRLLQISIIILFFLLQGCGSKSSPITPTSLPDTPSHLTDSQTTVPTNRYLWGIWDVRISGDRESVEIIPDRSSTMHFNTVRLMEEVPCTTCITIIIKQLIPPGVLSVDFRLEHPFPAPMNLTAFDLRGIIINGADYTFPANNRTVGLGHGKLVLLDPDGYTTLFNPTEFSEDSGMPPVLRYYPGKLELDGDLSSTLNPFIAYSKDLPRRVFYAGSAETRNIHVRLPDGPVEFGYAVDVSWMPVENVVDPLVDFPPEANCVEAYRIDLPDYMEVTSGEMSEIVVEVFDHQGYETISSVTAEAPEIFTGMIPFDFVESTGIESCTYSGEITNELNSVSGNYPLLVRVTDKFLDDIHGQIDAWQIGEVNVLEPPKEDPVAIAMADPLSVYTGDPVHFFDDGSYDPDGGDIVLFEWDWENDGTFDETGEDVFHSWTDPGTYEVQFRVTDDEGATDLLDVPIAVIIEQPQATWDYHTLLSNYRIRMTDCIFDMNDNPKIVLSTNDGNAHFRLFEWMGIGWDHNAIAYYSDTGAESSCSLAYSPGWDLAMAFSNIHWNANRDSDITIRYAGSSTWNHSHIDTEYCGGYLNSIDHDGAHFGVAYKVDDDPLWFAYGEPGNWHRELVATGWYMSYGNLAFDSFGNPYISQISAFGNDPVVVYYNTGGTWQNVTVDAGNCNSAVIAAGNNGEMFMVYWSGNDIMFASGNSGSLSTNVLVLGAGVGGPPSWYESTDIETDSSGQPHIVFIDYSNVKIAYWFRNESGWHNEEVADTVTSKSTVSMALDSYGRPIIAYNGPGGWTDLRVAWKH